MSIHVALHHQTVYRYDRRVSLGPQVIRLRPAPHCRTPILSYSLKVLPKNHFINWQQDPQSNYLARLVFPEPTTELSVEVDLVAEMAVYNPFDFFLEPHAEQYPFTYTPAVARELRPFLEIEPDSPRLSAFLAKVPRQPQRTMDFLVALNQMVQREIGYVIRMEPGVQSCEETLTLSTGSCRDSAWLLVQIMRRLGLAARFVSGYLIQLVADVKPLEGASGPTADFTDLHAWAEAYLPGAGWVGFDPTSGLLAGKGHIPLACTPDASSAAPIFGLLDPCNTEFRHEMTVQRIYESPPRHQATQPATMAANRKTRPPGRLRSAFRGRSAYHGRGADFRIPRRRRWVRMDHGRAGAGKAAAQSTYWAGCGNASLPRDYCISARASGIRASLCRAGHSDATGGKTRSPFGRMPTSSRKTARTTGTRRSMHAGLLRRSAADSR